MFKCPSEPLLSHFMLAVLGVLHGYNIHNICDFLHILGSQLSKKLFLVQFLFNFIILFLHKNNFLFDISSVGMVDIASIGAYRMRDG